MYCLLDQKDSYRQILDTQTIFHNLAHIHLSTGKTNKFMMLTLLA